MATRDYFLASHPYTEPGSGRKVREITERLEDGSRSVLLLIGDEDAVATVQVLRRAYQDGRYDRTQELLP